MYLEPSHRRLMSERLRQAAVVKNGGREYGIASRLSEELGVSVQTASKWLRGTVTPEVERWPALALALDVSIEWLTGGTHEEPDSLKGKLDQESVQLVGQTAALVVPLILRLKPNLPQSEIDELFKHAYQQLRSGKSKEAVSGELAAKLL